MKEDDFWHELNIRLERSRPRRYLDTPVTYGFVLGCGAVYLFYRFIVWCFENIYG